MGIIVMQDGFPLFSLAQLKGDLTGWLHRCLLCINKAAFSDGLRVACTFAFFFPSPSEQVICLEKNTPSSGTWAACFLNAEAQTSAANGENHSREREEGEHVHNFHFRSRIVVPAHLSA